MSLEQMTPQAKVPRTDLEMKSSEEMVGTPYSQSRRSCSKGKTGRSWVLKPDCVPLTSSALRNPQEEKISMN